MKKLLLSLAIIMCGIPTFAEIDLSYNTAINDIIANKGHVTYSIYALVDGYLLHTRNDYSCSTNKRAILWAKSNGRDVSFIIKNLRQYSTVNINEVPELYDILRSYCQP